MNFDTQVGSPNIPDPRFAGGSTPINANTMFHQQMNPMQPMQMQGGGPSMMMGGDNRYNYAFQLQQALHPQTPTGQGGSFPHEAFAPPGGGGPMGGPQPENSYQYMTPQPDNNAEIFHPSSVYSELPMQQQFHVTPKLENGAANYPLLQYWKIFLVMVFLVIIFHNSMIYGLQRYCTPAVLRTTASGNPPIAVVIFNALLAGTVFILILRYTSLAY